MKTAVLIQSHNNSRYICKLAEYFPSIRFYIHIDRKNTHDFNFIKEKKLSNIFLIEERINVFWGGVSQIKATLLLLNEAEKNKENHYFHLMSGECLPLTSFYEMEKEWDKTPHINFIESHIDNNNSWRLKVRVPHSDTKYLRTFIGKAFNKMLKYSTYIKKTTSFSNDEFYFGSQWFSITRNLVSHIVSADNEHFFDSFKNITCADEHAFQILSRRIEEPCNIADNNKRFIHFKKKSSPEYLNESTLLKLDNNKYWFARKVKEDVTLDYLDRLKNNV
ncbi:conjugal transfer protein [Providencia sp. wls1914]|nr:beta-1,6-N-acetylglucosaminyltransferase [Providencia sp. wls1914]MTC70992.1 conjugal transfer protein [Providencia sp. wls1914]